MGNTPYLFIGALDLSPYIVSINSPAISLRGLSLELEKEIYFILSGIKLWNSFGYFELERGHVAIASSIGCGSLESAQYSDAGKLGLTLVHNGKQLSYFIWLRNLDNKWWTRSNPKRESWREKQVKLL